MSKQSVELVPVPAFRDNYIWLFHRRGDRRAFVVDPGEAPGVEAALAERQLELAGILITHHHPDHVGGLNTLLRHRRVPVYGPSASVPQVDRPVTDGEQVALPNDMGFEVAAVPGHTLDHLAFYWAGEAAEAPILFCGDTLFAGGCGRLFEGQPAQMYDSLQRLTAFPGATRICCAHEYTLANLAFARAVEDDNAALQARCEREEAKRARGLPTLPSRLDLEMQTNPFLRCREGSVQKAAEARAGRALASPQAVFATVRQWKDNF